MPFNTDPTRRASSDGAAQAVSDEGAPNKANSAKPLPDRSDIADAAARGAEEMAHTVSSRLRSAGIDTDAMIAAAKKETTHLQHWLRQEISTRPLRALGIAGALGLVVGLVTSRG
jgi:hypothetical protein